MVVAAWALFLLTAQIQGVVSTESNCTIILPESLTGHIGLCMLIPCNYSHAGILNTSQFEVDWYKQNQTSSPITVYHMLQSSIHQDYRSRAQLIGNLTQLDCSLVINSIGDGDDGTYYFRIKLVDLNQTCKSAPLSVTVSGLELKPNISSTSTIVENEKITLTCTFHHYCGGIAPNLTWTNITALNTSSPFNGTESDDTNSVFSISFTFLPAAEDNGKQVGCRAQYNHSNAESLQTFLLDVQYGPKIDLMKEITVNESDQVTIECIVNSNPVSNIMWLKNNRSIISAVNKSLTLEINNISHRDTGYYCCRAQNAYDTVQKILNFTVNYGPRIEPMDQPSGLLEGHPLQLDCLVNSHPLSNITWSRDGAVLNWTVSEKLTLSNAAMRESDSALYTCSAWNPFGNANLSVDIQIEYAPRNLSIVVPDNGTIISTIWTDEGSALSLLCSVESIPPSNLTWRVNGSPRNFSTGRNGLWLHFEKVTYLEDGGHECVAMNTHGKAQGSVNVRLRYSPKEISVRVNGTQQGIREGDNVTLTCFCKSNPPVTNYSWFHLHGKSMGFVGSSKTLNLGVVSRDNDESWYYCRAENKLGSSNSSLWDLSVEYMPEFTQESGCFRDKQKVTCTCVANSNPPGNLTWHLPHANYNSNITHGIWESWQFRDGDQVIGSLIMTGPQDEEEVMASCSVRNLHGEAMFKVYLWVQGDGLRRDQIILGAVAGALGMLILSLLLCQIFICCRRNEKRHPIDRTELEMLTGQPTLVRSFSLVAEEEVGEAEADLQSEEVVAQMENADTQTEETQVLAEEADPQTEVVSEAGSPKTVENGEAGQEAEELHYACIVFSKPSASDEIVGRRDSTQYAQIKPQ
ncbi:myelin-associated glycoprotein-like [Scyliorhinus canicula]|uniref:myelin-associated glycoprotein-like n=1 Tax=Scyliorhinus canicula TaxID=7830 RepID=UPI0018F6507E|nr:myelin-associated glycoprotein-like [Scyliorhinus canicula]